LEGIDIGTPIAGGSARLMYGWETTFGSASGSINKAFSQGVKMTTFDVDNSVDYVYGLGSQDAQKSVVKEFKGSWGVEFTYSDSWFLKAVLGSDSAKTGVGPYTYTWTVANGGISNTLTSMTLDANFDLDTDSHQDLLGCIVNSMTFSGNVGEKIMCRLEGPFANLTKDATMIALISPVEEPFSFAAATFEMPNSSTITEVQSVELTFNRNPDMVYGLGSRFAQKNVPKQREWNLRVVAMYELDSQFWDNLLGSTTAAMAAPAEIATARLTVTNGLSTTSERSVTFTFGPCRVERGSLTGIEVESTIKQEITIRARTLTSVVVVNNTSAAL